MSREIVETIEINASPERVFRALTTPAELLLWWGDPAVCPSTHWELDLRVGGKWLSRWRMLADGREFALGGEIVTLDPPRLLILTWWDERYPELPATTVRYELEPRTGGVRLRMTHSGFDPARIDHDEYRGGWPHVLRSLRGWTEVAFRSNTDLALHVPDLDPAEAFYSGVLGLEVVGRSERHLQLRTGALTLWINREPAGPVGFVPSFDLADPSAARARLEAAGCRIERLAEDGSGYYVRDPFGASFDVIRRPDSSA